MRPQAIAPLGVRMPDTLKASLKELAAQNRRSVNSEIVTILERAVAEQTAEAKTPAVSA